MIKKRDNKDTFLELLSDVKPLRKSNKNFKKVETSNKNNLIGTNKKSVLNKNKIANVLLNKKNQNNTKKYETLEKFPINKKLKKGKIQIDKKIDFHGLTVDEARMTFNQTIEDCYFSNKRCILFITGKGIRGENLLNSRNKLFYGKIRNGFLGWVKQKNIVSKILNISPAPPSYGGDGAFFVYLRKNKI